MQPTSHNAVAAVSFKPVAKKLLIAFGIALTLIVLVNIVSIEYGRQVTTILESGEKQFAAVTSAANQISSDAKRAEGHLMLYLVYHRFIDREKVDRHIAALREQVNIVSRLVKHPRGRKMVGEIEALNQQVLAAVGPLLAAHDASVGSEAGFSLENHQSKVLAVYRIFSSLRRLGVELTELELDLETEMKARLADQAAKLSAFLYLATGCIIVFTFVLGVLMLRTHQALVKESEQRQQAETLERVKQQEYRNLFENMTLGVFYTDAEGLFTDANPAALALLGFSHNQCVGRTIEKLPWKVVDEECNDLAPEHYPSRRALQTGKTIRDQIVGVWCSARKAYNWVAVNAIPQFKPGEKHPWQVFVTLLDVTRLKEAKIALTESEQILQQLSSQTEQLSLAAAEMISIEDKELVFQKISDAIVQHSDFKRVVISLFKENASGRDIIGYAGITEAERDHLEPIQFAKQWFDGIFKQGIQVGRLGYYVPHTHKHIFGEWDIVFGQGPAPQTPDAWHPEDNLFVRLSDDRGRFIGVISVDESRSGQIPSAETIRPLEIFSSLISQIIILKREQEERRKVEAELHQLSAQTEQLSLAAAELISMEDKQQVFQKISDAIVAHSDYRRVTISLFKDEAPGRDIIGYAGLTDDERNYLEAIDFSKQWFDRVFENGVRVGSRGYYVPHTLKHIFGEGDIIYGTGSAPEAAGAWHPEDNLFVCMNDDKGRFIGVISVDESKSGQVPSAETIRPLETFSSLITQIIILKREQEERRRIEAQLQQAIKMETIGTLTGGIAHDFNNILGIILGNTELAIEESPPDHPLADNLEKIKTASLRAADIVRQLLSFSRKTDHMTQQVRILSVIEEATGLLRASMPSTVDLRKQIMDDDGVVMADAGQINQIVMNLCINAYQSMGDAKGTITITVRNVHLKEGLSAAGNNLAPGEYVNVVVEDTGPGISAKIRDRIFDPYFTTKTVGKGSGLGLAVVLGILKAHNGGIRLESAPDQGSRFSFYLPAVQAIEDQPEQSVPMAMAAGTEQVLFVDDDPAIAEMTEEILKRLGYRHTVFTDSRDALRAVEAHPARFDLLVTDMTMPHLTGAELTDAVKSIRPDLPVIICTGHSELMDEQRSRAAGIAAYVMKPIVLKNFAAVIRDVLDKKTPS